MFPDALMERNQLILVGNMGRYGQNMCRALRGLGGHCLCCQVERVAWQIRQYDLHAQCRETPGGRKSDATRGAGDDGHFILRKG
jgi:hypothetical protein